MASFTIPIRGPFSLAASSEFLCGFTPAKDCALHPEGGLALAFRLDKSFAAVSVSLREEGGDVRGEAVGTDDIATARAQMARILSLDHDGTGWAAVGERDAVIGELQARYRLRPVCFASPYEAGV